MKLEYTPSTIEGTLRTIHKINIDGETLETTRAKEILKFAKPRIYDKFVWKELKKSVRLGHNMTVSGGDLFS